LEPLQRGLERSGPPDRTYFATSVEQTAASNGHAFPNACSGSDRGDRAAAMHFSLIGSCLRNNVEPFAYPRELLTRLPALLARLGAARDDPRSLLPDRWQDAK